MCDVTVSDVMSRSMPINIYVSVNCAAAAVKITSCTDTPIRRENRVVGANIY